jgi:hypothetical protein
MSTRRRRDVRGSPWPLGVAAGFKAALDQLGKSRSAVARP